MDTRSPRCRRNLSLPKCELGPISRPTYCPNIILSSGLKPGIALLGVNRRVSARSASYKCESIKHAQIIVAGHAIVCPRSSDGDTLLVSNSPACRGKDTLYGCLPDFQSLHFGRVSLVMWSMAPYNIPRQVIQIYTLPPLFA